MKTYTVSALPKKYNLGTVKNVKVSHISKFRHYWNKFKAFLFTKKMTPVSPSIISRRSHILENDNDFNEFYAMLRKQSEQFYANRISYSVLSKLEVKESIQKKLSNLKE